MATNFITADDNFKYIPTSAVTSGSLGIYDGVVGIALSNRTATELADATRTDDDNAIAIATKGVYNVPVEGAATVTKGIKVYLISGNMITHDSDSDTREFVGTTYSAKKSDDTADVILNRNLTGL